MTIGTSILLIAAVYIGLIALLVLGMHATNLPKTL